MNRICTHDMSEQENSRTAVIVPLLATVVLILVLAALGWLAMA